MSVAAALTIGPAYLYGISTHRWGQPADFAVAADHLDRFPTEMGNWQRVSDNKPLSKGVSKELGLVDEIGRNYVDSNSGETVGLVLMLGHTGRLVRHPPEICYDNRANERVGEFRTIVVGDGRSKHEFGLLEFRKDAGGVEEHFMVAYGFADDGGVWKCPSVPRLEYGGKPKLYKMQAISAWTTGDAKDAEKRLVDYLGEFAKAFPVLATTNGRAKKGT